MISGKFNAEDTQKRTYIRAMIEYFNRTISKVKEGNATMWKHFSKLIDSVEDLQITFPFGFDFNAYYETFNETADVLTIKICKQKYN
jgi:hypothetical protein